jgi:hypothetical protein
MRGPSDRLQLVLVGVAGSVAIAGTNHKVRLEVEGVARPAELKAPRLRMHYW